MLMEMMIRKINLIQYYHQPQHNNKKLTSISTEHPANEDNRSNVKCLNSTEPDSQISNKLVKIYAINSAIQQTFRKKQVISHMSPLNGDFFSLTLTFLKPGGFNHMSDTQSCKASDLFLFTTCKELEKLKCTNVTISVQHYSH